VRVPAAGPLQHVTVRPFRPVTSGPLRNVTR
jgi:hypothetical protein